MPFSRQHEMAVLLAQTDDLFSKVRFGAELARLRSELIHEVFREHARKAADVEDELLRIQRLELSSELR